MDFFFPVIIWLPSRSICYATWRKEIFSRQFEGEKGTQRTKDFTERSEKWRVCYNNWQLNKSVDVPRSKVKKMKKKNKKQHRRKPCSNRWRNVDTKEWDMKNQKWSNKKHLLKDASEKLEQKVFFFGKKKAKSYFSATRAILDLWQWPSTQNITFYHRFHWCTFRNRAHPLAHGPPPPEVQPDLVKFVFVSGWEKRAHSRRYLDNLRGDVCNALPNW